MAKKLGPLRKRPVKKMPAAAQKKGERFEMLLGKREKREFQAAAKRHGISLAHWLRLAAWKVINEHGGSVELVELE